MTVKVLTQVFSLFVLCVVLISAEQCISGPFHMNTSSPATKEYAECKAWSDNTCCTANFTEQLNKTRVRDLYGFHWGHCKNISKKCEKFLVEEECFYQCEPRLFLWHVAKGTIKGVPICGDYCDAWYDACKDDETCVENWLTGFDFSNNIYTCPRDAKCQTFKQVYGSGKELCNKMWGTSFRYVDPKCPCSKMNAPIPDGVNATSTCSGSSRITLFSAYSLLVSVSFRLTNWS